MDEDLRSRVDDHCGLFNAAVRSGDFTRFVATFAPDAVMRFVNVPAGPYVGRDMIAQAYREQPPTDTMTLTSVEALASDSALVRFTWDAGGTGTMTVRWTGPWVAELTVSFD
ncbi:MAG TPA: nuclear transport factor 2 family protein [Micromonosporaceae bacterium]|nr:nuclear transport factor 2 family protein [Micromonosporaceae bacterium]